MGLKAKVKFLLRQFPFVYPFRVINSCQGWIKAQGKKKGAYLSQRGPWFKVIFPESFIQNPAPKTIGKANDKAFYNNRNYPVPKAILFYLQNSYLFRNKGLVLTAKHEVFQEFSHNFGADSLKTFLHKRPFYTFSKRPKKINGVGAVLVSPESHNYYHWLNDVLPRIKIYEPVFDQIDYFCIAENVPSKFLDVLPDFGIPPGKILFVRDDEKLHFDHLFVASLPGSEGRSPTWAIEYIREKLIKANSPVLAKKRLYFKRGSGVERCILNEDKIIARLQTVGFDIVEPGELTINQQVQLLQSAQIVLSAHGAALSNLLFGPDSTTVIELFSPDYFRTDCYYTLSAIRRLNYWYILCDKPPGAAWGDVVVNEGLLMDTIQQAQS